MSLSPLIKSSLLWFLAACCWVFGYMYPNQHNVPIIITNLWKGIMIPIVNYFLMLYYNNKAQKKICLDIRNRDDFKWSMLRAILYVAACGLFGQALFYVSLPVAFSINNFTSLVVMMLDYLVFGIVLNRQQILAGIIGFVGITILTLNSGVPQQTSFSNYHNSQPIYRYLALLALILNVLFMSFSIILTKKITHLHPFSISFQIGLIFLYSSSFLYICLPKIIQHGLIVSGSIFALSNYCQVMALQGCQQSGVVVLAEFSVLGLAYLVSLIRYGEQLNYFSLMGTIMTGICGYLVITSGKKVQSHIKQIKSQNYHVESQSVDIKYKNQQNIHNQENK